MAEEFIDPDSYFSLSPVEMGNERNAITAAVAGIVSGIIKVPEGVISLGKYGYYLEHLNNLN